MGSVPTIDLSPWFEGSDEAKPSWPPRWTRRCSPSGFEHTGHGVSRDDRGAIRTATTAITVMFCCAGYLVSVLLKPRSALCPR